MSYAAEPYAQFVEDLLLSLTGGVARERFVFLPENAPFRLSPPGPVVPSSLVVFGQVEGAYRRFVADTDFLMTSEAEIEWLAGPDGVPAADAVWPDEGTPFFVNYDHRGPSGTAPRLNDRNPGSVVRLLSESFGREYAVLSRQLEGVYRAGFLDTAEGRDLDQLVRLVGLERRDRTYASGTVVFSRGTPAPADIFVPEGTRLSTAEPPAAEFETTEDSTLHRGNLSVEVPIRARKSGPSSVVPARAISVIHRPLLGIEKAENPQGTQLSGAVETDEALRARARRALETAGAATSGALMGALATLPGVREKDILLSEDPLVRPGIVTVSVAAELAPEQVEHAVELIESTRPAGVRVLHRLDAAGVGPESISPGPNLVPELEGDPTDSTDGEGLYAPVIAKAILVPASGALSPQDRIDLKAAGEAALAAAVDDAGIGEPVVYNKVVAALMNLDGVIDVALELYPLNGSTGPRHRNVFPGSTRRPSVTKEGGAMEVRIAGEVIALDVTVTITLVGTGLEGDLAANRDAARFHVLAQLRDGVATLSALKPNELLGLITAPSTFTVDALSYTGEYLTAGVKLNGISPEIPLTAQELAWIRNVKVAP